MIGVMNVKIVHSNLPCYVDVIIVVAVGHYSVVNVPNAKLYGPDTSHCFYHHVIVICVVLCFDPCHASHYHY
jgi:hypothetical protein